MAIFPSPSAAPYGNPVTWEMEFKTLRSNFDDLGEEKRKRKWLYPKRNISLKYPAITRGEAETIYEFYQARSGSYGAFVWFESTGRGDAYRSYSSEYTATGDSTTLIFNLPAKGSSITHDVNLDASVVSTSDYTFAAGGGGDGEDKVTFISSTAGGIGAPTSTQRMTYDFTGRLKIRCRFAEDRLTWENFYDRIVNTSITLKGLLNQ